MRWTERQRAMLEEMGIRLWCRRACRDARAVERALAAPVAPAPRSDDGCAECARHAGPSRVADAPGGVDTMDWPALREAVAACTACELCGPHAHGVRRRQRAGALDDRRRSAGRAGDLQGEPFVGKAGQLLDNMLRALGLTRAPRPTQIRQVYIANTLKCRPPGNRNPEPDELALCEPFLSRQVALVQPRIILAMGRFAVQSAAAQRRADRPAARPGAPLQGVPVVVTYHPAYLLRNPRTRRAAWDDLCLALEVARACPTRR